MKNYVKIHLIKLIVGLVACSYIGSIQPAAAARKAPMTKKDTIVGVGVLIYALNPKNGKYDVLLGKEKFVDKGTYSDFGGSAEIKDGNNPITTAACELEEESERIFGKFDYRDCLKKHRLF